MKRINVFAIVLVLFFFLNACDEVPDDVILLEIDTKELTGDGSSQSTVRAILHKESLEDKRMVKFTASQGTFVDGEDNTITKKAECQQYNKDNECTKVFVEVQFIAPLSGGKVEITAEVEGIEVKDCINLSISEPSSIELEANRFSVEIDYQGEVEIVGTLSNAEGNKVSKGFKVLFEDYFINSNSPRVGGAFRATNNLSNSNAQVSTVYSPGRIPVDSSFWIFAFVLDTNEEKTNNKDSLEIFTINP